MKTSMRVVFSILTLVFLVAPGASSKEPSASATETTVRIQSNPPGAMVLLCRGSTFREGSAIPLGRTPLMRYMPLSQSGDTIRVSKSGFQLWTGPLAPGASELKATLAPLTDQQKKELNWTNSPPCNRLTVVPIRVGIRKRGAEAMTFGHSEAATRFTNRFFTALEGAMKKRFPEKCALVFSPQLEAEDAWHQLTRQMSGVHIPTIGYTPAPLRLDFTPEINGALAKIDGAVLLLRAEAQYLGKGALFARAAVPLLLSAGSAAGGYFSVQATGASHYSYSVFGAPPNNDFIVVQMFLVHPTTRELMWYGQLVMPQYFDHDQVTEKAAAQAFDQVPAALLQAHAAGLQQTN